MDVEEEGHRHKGDLEAAVEARLRRSALLALVYHHHLVRILLVARHRQGPFHPTVLLHLRMERQDNTVHDNLGIILFLVDMIAVL